MELAISTTTVACSVALLNGETIVAERHQVIGRGHAELLIPMIAELPHKGRADRIWIDCGPGSFTGTRVGLAAARALALAWQADLSGFSTMALLAAGVTNGEATIAVAIAGGHGELFVQSFNRDPIAPTDEIVSLPPEEAAHRIGARIILGSGAADLVQARGYGEARDTLPRAANIRELPDALRSLPSRPIYGREPDAKAAIS